MNLFRLKFSMILIDFFITNQIFSMERSISVELIEIEYEDVKNLESVTEKIRRERTPSPEIIKLMEMYRADSAYFYTKYIKNKIQKHPFVLIKHSEVDTMKDTDNFIKRIKEELNSDIYIWEIDISSKKNVKEDLCIPFTIYNYMGICIRDNKVKFHEYMEQNIKNNIYNIWLKPSVENNIEYNIYVYYSKKESAENHNKNNGVTKPKKHCCC